MRQRAKEQDKFEELLNLFKDDSSFTKEKLLEIFSSFYEKKGIKELSEILKSPSFNELFGKDYAMVLPDTLDNIESLNKPKRKILSDLLSCQFTNDMFFEFIAKSKYNPIHPKIAIICPKINFTG